MQNISASLSGGVSFLIDCYGFDIYSQAAKLPEGFVEINYLSSNRTPIHYSDDIKKIIQLAQEEFPQLCKKQGLHTNEYLMAKARFISRGMNNGFIIYVKSQKGRSTIEGYDSFGTRNDVIEKLYN